MDRLFSECKGQSKKKKKKNTFYICPESWNLNIHEFSNSKNFPFIFSLEKLV